MLIIPYFNTDEERLIKKAYNIFIPICLGNKFFTEKNIPTQNVTNYINWALEYSKEKVLVLVVDDIQITNYLVRNHKVSYNRNKEKVMRDGNEIKKNLEKIVAIFPEHQQEKIGVIQWKDYVKEDPYVGPTTQLIYKEFKNNTNFRDEILETVKASVKDRPFSNKEYWLLCDYLLDEFSICYSGLKYKGIHYNMFPYPNPDAASDFIEKIKLGTTFPKLADKLPQTKAVFTILH